MKDMLNPYQKQLNRLRLFSKILIIFTFFGIALACTPKYTKREKTLTEREMIYQKGLTLFSINKFAEATPFFIKVIHHNEGPHDELYNSSLWCLSVIYDREGSYDKALLSLLELNNRNSAEVSSFKIQLSLAKNYFRLDNAKKALDVLRSIELSKPQSRLPIPELYFANLENSHFNFDQTLLEELLYLRESQKFFLYVMESSEPKINQQASDTLKSIYSDFLKIIQKSNLDDSFRRKVAVQILDNLRALDTYKLDDKLSEAPVKSFFTFSTQKQTELVDWLHQ